MEKRVNLLYVICFIHILVTLALSMGFCIHTATLTNMSTTLNDLGFAVIDLAKLVLPAN